MPVPARVRGMGRVSDEELLRMLRQVEDAEDAAEEAVVEAVEVGLVPEAPAFDPCPQCGEPAQNRGECHVCHDEGCLPPDEWTPGMADACLTLCVRCARTIHLGCSAEDGAGNPRCATCAF